MNQRTRVYRPWLLMALWLGASACGDDDGTTGVSPDMGPADMDIMDSAAPDLPPPDMDMDAGPGTVLEVAEAAGSFTTLVGAIDRAGLTADLGGEGPFTVFAPTDAAFTALEATVDIDGLTAAELANVLRNHVVAGEVRSDALPATADNLAGLTLVIDAANARVNGALLTMTDIAADNGIIHVIDAVMLPASILDVAGFAGLTGLAGALGDAGLDEDLAGGGPFTVFAPTNDGFGRLGTVPTGEALAEVLAYHVVEGAVASDAIPARADAVAGFTLFFDTSAGVQVNGIDVVVADVRTTNGIVHVIDDVLLPPDIPTAATLAGLSTLVGAVVDAELADDLSAPGPFTVFAPTNAAFAGLDAVPTGDALVEVLTYHVLPSEVASDAIPPRADALADLTLFFDTTAGVQVNGIDVVVADVRTTNGIVHVIDDVLLPPDIPTAATLAGLSTLVGAVVDAELADDLSAPGPFTVFAPTNAAFAALPAVPTGDALVEVLTYHVLTSEVRAADVPARANALATNAFGNPLTLLFDTSAGVAVNDIDVIIADVKTTNGVVHVIDDVLIPLDVLALAELAGFTELQAALGRASGDLPTTLASAGPFTLFAPTDAAFTAIASTVDGLSAEALRTVLLYHLVDSPTPVLSSGLADGPVPSLAGQDINVDVTAFTVQGARLESGLLDLHVTNGVVHVVNDVLIPPAL